ncbi:MAG: 4Fe-4S ferredoxin [Deltaproteobacteria bacterium]|nr:MAG: 4Fe-4S ferredoxin [Deltaproteobacteria bacterium]
MQQNYSVYRKLQQHLDKFPIGFPPTKSGVEIELLQYLFTEQEAKIAAGLNLIAEPVEKISPRLRDVDLSALELESCLDRMAEKGLINWYTKRDGAKFYSIAFLAVGIFEFQVEQMTPEFYRLFKQYLDEAFRDEILRTKIPQLRTIPSEGSITPELPIDNYDHIRKLINDFDREILVADCVCKIGQDSIGHPCQVTDMREICLVFGSAAKKYAHLGWGRIITKEEVFEILSNAEKDGLVIQPSNTQKLFAICLCCGCCCEILTSARPLENPVQYFATNFQAVVDEEECIGCGRCIKRCQMDAVSLVDEKAVIDYSRCIGCGVCVPTCKPQAIKLERKEIVRVPPKDSARLYMSIMKKKVGNARQMIMLTKQLLGRLV